MQTRHKPSKPFRTSFREPEAYGTSHQSFPSLATPANGDIYGTLGTWATERRAPQATVLPTAGDAVRSGSGSESRSESWRLRSEWRPEWGTESVHHPIMVARAATPASRSEIAAAIGNKSITGSLREALADLMAAGFAEYTIPRKPNSRLQKHRRTMKTTSGASSKRALNAPNTPRPTPAKSLAKPTTPSASKRGKGLSKGSKGSSLS